MNRPKRWLIFGFAIMLTDSPNLLDSAKFDQEAHSVTSNAKQMTYREKLADNLRIYAYANYLKYDSKLSSVDLILFMKNRYPAIVQEQLNEVMKKHPISLFEGDISNPLNYFIDNSGNINESTTAEYYTDHPETRFIGEGLDFDILAAVNFGLRSYYFDGTGQIIKEWGDYNTAYYSVAYNPNKNQFVLVSPGVFKMQIVNKGTLEIEREITGYAAFSVEIYNDEIYFAGYEQDEGDWDALAIYRIGADGSINKLTVSKYADVRGFILHNDKLFISDGYHKRIVVYDLISQKEKVINRRFQYPNNITLSAQNTILIAEEHNDIILEVDPESFMVIRETDPRQLRSPASAIEIEKGKYKGYWLVADTDQQRIIVVNPNTWDIVYETRNLRSVLKAIPIYHE